MKKGTFILAILMATKWAKAQQCNELQNQNTLRKKKYKSYNMKRNILFNDISMRIPLSVKKAIFGIAFLMIVCAGRAQSYAAFEHSFGWYFQYMEGLTEMRDGNILTCTELHTADSTGYYTGAYGFCFLKLNRENASIMDSVFLPIADDVSFYMMEPNPSGEGYLFVNRKNDTLTGNNILRIRHFDENLVFHEEDEISVLLDSLSVGVNYYLLEENSFILMNGEKTGPHVFQRFGLDGTLLNRVVYPYSACPFSETSGLRVWNDCPREYVFTGWKDLNNCSFYVLDSLFDLKETIPMGNPPQSNVTFLMNNFDAKVENLDEETYLMATPYDEHLQFGFQPGILVIKRDKATHANLKTIYFPFKEHFTYGFYVTDLRLTEDGHVYLAYGDNTGQNPYSVVLMDSDLNILWQMYYQLEASDYGYKLRLLSDGGVSIIGFQAAGPKVFALLVNNDYDGLEEQGIIVRPYMFYPNPVQDELHLQFSPDVIPTQIELYDLQGRLMRTQKNGLERLEMNGLPAGTYTMRVTLEGGKVFSDKVVKE